MLPLPLALQAQKTVPWSVDFSDVADYEDFTVIDANNDKYTFSYDDLFEAAYGKRNYDANDWLISPAITLQTGKAYSLSYSISGYDEKSTDTYEVKLGKSNTVAAMTTTIAATANAPQDYWSRKTVTTYFTVEAEGDYYIGWHHNTTGQANSGALSIYEIKLIEGANLATPSSVTELNITPGSNGALTATIDFKAPATTQGGNALTALTKIEIYRDDALIGTVNNVTPGEALTYTDLSPKNGVNNYKLIPYNSEGAGAATATATIGVDIPSAVTSVKLKYVNGKAILIWDPVTTGANGAYVNPAQITYSVRRGKSGGGPVLATGLTSTTFEDTPDVDDAMALLWYYVTPSNTAGTAKSTRSSVVVTGKPTPLPFIETFAGGKIHNFWWEDHNASQRWGSYSQSTNFAQDDGGGFGLFTPEYEGDWSVYQTGLIDLGEAKNPILSFYYRRAYPSNDIFHITVANGYEKVDTIKTLDLTPAQDNKWTHVVLPLKSYVGSDFIQVGFDYTTKLGFNGIYRENVRIFDQLDNDLTIEATATPRRLKAGETSNFQFKVTNYGSTDSKNYTVAVMKGDKVLASQDGTEVKSFESKYMTLKVTPELNFGEQVTLVGKLTYDADENLDNNTTDDIVVAVKYCSYPTARQLTAGEGNNLSWLAPEPANTVDTYVTEGFEDYTDFTISDFGEWTLYDVDKSYVYSINGATYDNMAVTQSWTVFNATATEPAIKDKNWAAYNGNKCLVSFCSYSTTNENWLVSPELPGKAQTISMWLKANKDGEDQKYYILYSTDGIERTDFELLTQTPQVVPTTWTQNSFNLPEGTKYFAVVDVTNDGWATLIDDITFLPDSSAAKNLSLVGYNIYRNGEKINNSVVTSTSFKDTDTTETNVYNVTAVYTAGESAFSNSASMTTGIADINADTNVANTNIYDMSGRRINQITQPGVYIINGKKAVVK